MSDQADKTPSAAVAAPARSQPEPTSATDDELVAAVRGGNEEAFEVLFNRHRRRVAGIAGRFFNRQEQIEDIIQESFVKAYFALNTYAGKHEHSFSAWLARIATNVSYDELRRTRRHPERPESELTEQEAAWMSAQLRTDTLNRGVEEAVVSRDLASKLLARLDPDDRLVLQLLNAEDASVSEVAELTGWSTAKVKVRAHRARASLRRILGRFL